MEKSNFSIFKHNFQSIHQLFSRNSQKIKNLWLIRNTHTFNDIIFDNFFTSFNKTLFSTFHFGCSAATDAHFDRRKYFQSRTNQQNIFNQILSVFSSAKWRKNLVIWWEICSCFWLGSVLKIHREFRQNLCFVAHFMMVGNPRSMSIWKAAEFFFDVQSSSDFLRNFWTEKSGQVGDPKSG